MNSFTKTATLINTNQNLKSYIIGAEGWVHRPDLSTIFNVPHKLIKMG